MNEELKSKLLLDLSEIQTLVDKVLDTGISFKDVNELPNNFTLELFGIRGRINHMMASLKSSSLPSLVDYSQSNPSFASRQKNEFTVNSREDAEKIVEKMADLCDQYGAVTVSDRNQLIGLSTTFFGDKLGWPDTNGIEIKQVRDGWLLVFPPAFPINR